MARTEPAMRCPWRRTCSKNRPQKTRRWWDSRVVNPGTDDGLGISWPTVSIANDKLLWSYEGGGCGRKEPWLYSHADRQGDKRKVLCYDVRTGN